MPSGYDKLREVPFAPLGFRNLYGLQQFNNPLPPLSPADLGESSEPSVPSYPWNQRVTGPMQQSFNELESRGATPPYPSAGALDEYLRRLNDQRLQFEGQLWDKGQFPRAQYENKRGPGPFGSVLRGYPIGRGGNE
jgi:hypothetical protein